MLNKKFLKEFNEPSNEWRLAPFWFLNHRLEDAGTGETDLHEMAKAGLGGFVLHARHGIADALHGRGVDAQDGDVLRGGEVARDVGRGSCMTRTTGRAERRTDGWTDGSIRNIEAASFTFRSARWWRGGRGLRWNCRDRTNWRVCCWFVPTEEDGSFKVDTRTKVRELTRKVRAGVLKARIPKGHWTVTALSRHGTRGGHSSTITPTC